MGPNGNSHNEQTYLGPYFPQHWWTISNLSPKALWLALTNESQKRSLHVYLHALYMVIYLKQALTHLRSKITGRSHV